MNYKTCESCIGKKCPYNKECAELYKTELEKALKELKENFWKGELK